MLLFLFLTAGLSAAVAANLLTNPGFEAGSNGWSGVVRGSTVTVVTDATAAHSGTNYASCYNAAGWSSVSQGDSQGAYSTGVSLPVSDAKFYKLSAWVKVPGAATTPQTITLRYRFEPSGNRVDVGAQSINTENWTQLQSAWIQPAIGDTFMSYFEIHSLNNAVTFYADDCALTESDPLVLNGRVVDAGGAGVDNATVAAASADYSTPQTVTAGGGYYSLTVPPGNYTIGASTPGFKGSTTVTVSTTPTTAPNIVLAVDPDYDPDLIFSAYSTSIPAAGAWPAASPAGLMLSRIGAPTTELIGGVQWEKNVADGPGWRVGGENLSAIPCNGATAIAVIRMAAARTASNNWDSVIDVFYDRLVLGVRNDTGLVNVRCNGTLDYAPANTAFAEGQKVILSLVVQPTGTYIVYANGTQIMSGTAQNPTDMTALTPGGQTYMHYIDVGRNDPDGWTTFNGNIGDVYLYNTAITDAKRTALEASLKTKFGVQATIYTIAASVVGPGGTITPSGAAVGVPGGTDKTFTITPEDPLIAYYAIDRVVVDGVDQGPITSYTFKNVNANGHSIVAYFKPIPHQVVSGRVTDGGNGIMGATVYFNSSANASVNPTYTTTTTTYDGNYSMPLPSGNWYVAAGADFYNTSADSPLTLGNAPATLDFALTKQISSMQPMLVSKGTGAARTNLAGVVGYAFTTGAYSIDVSQLGFVDWAGTGLSSAHSIGLWQGVDLVSSATVSAGTGSTKVGDFRYAAANPVVTLAPFTTYVIGAEVFPGGDSWPDSAPSPGVNVPDFSGVGSFVSRRHDVQEFVEPEIVWTAGQVGAACNLIGKMVTPPTVKVSGVVKDAYGAGINNAVIQIGGVGGPATVSDANGKYKFFDVPIGAGQELYADALGFANNAVTIDTTNAATVPVAKDITLTGKLETGVIVNGGFEGGLAPWVLNYGSPIVGVSSNTKYSGNFAGYWKSTAAVWYDGYLSYQMPIVADSTYNIYFKLKTSAAIGQCGFDFLDAAGNEAPWWGYAGGLVAGANWMYTTVPNKWEQVLNYRSWDNSAQTVGVRLTPPVGTAAIRIICALGADAVGQTLFVDDVVIDRVGPDAPAGPFTTLDVINSLRWAGGLSTLPQNYLPRYDVEANGKIDLADALRIARKSVGLDTNP
jgi:hypothetical protein